MKFNIILALLISVFAGRIFAQEKIYLGINPLSYALVLPLQEDIKRYSPVLAGNEYGISLVAGCSLKKRISLETRIALGNIHQVASVKQLHAGIIVHPFIKKENKDVFPLYTGVFLKIWDYHNRLTDISFYNACPYFVIGYQFSRKRWITDIRMNQTLAIVSWTNLEDSTGGASFFLSPWPGLIKVLPTLTCTIAYKIGA